MALDCGPSRKRIDLLLVAGDRNLADAIASYFAGAGLTVCAAASGTLAFKLLEQVEPRLAVLDYHLPDLTGLDVAFRLRGLLPEPPIVLMSATALEGLEQEALDKAGINMFLNKAVSPRALFENVVQLIEQG